MTAESSLFHKPKSFLAARQTLYASIFLGALGFLLSYVNLGIATRGGAGAIVAVAAFYIIIILLIRQMSFCKKWARTILLILYVLAILSYPVTMRAEFKTNMIEGAIVVIQSALQIYALVLLYNKECNAWFNSSATEVQRDFKTN